jgi:phage I-like protein
VAAAASALLRGVIGTEPTYTLHTLRVATDALKGEALPNRIKLLAWGDNKAADGGLYHLGARSAELLPRLQKEYGYEEIALDYEHNTVPGSPEYQRSQEPRPVAAFGTLSVVPGDGLFMDITRWTPSGKTEAPNFADLSPSLMTDPSGEVIFLHSAALTRNGAVEGLKLQLNSAQLRKYVMPENTPPAAPAADQITVAELAPALGLDATADKAAVLGKLKILSAGPDLSALDARIKAIESARAGDSAAAEGRERDALVTQASREGKIIPLSADALKLVPVVALKEIVEKLPKGQVPLGARAGQPSVEITTLSAAIEAEMKTGKTKFQAIQTLAAKQPELYAAYRETGGSL